MADRPKLDIEAIKRRERAATPGPWSWWDSCSFRRLSSDATMKDGDVLCGDIQPADGHPDVRCKPEDREFIASARVDIPALLARVAELEGILKGFVVGRNDGLKTLTIHYDSPARTDADDDQPTMTCPHCKAEEPDFDGFGMLAHVKPAFPNGCGWCSHPSAQVVNGKSVCGICGDIIDVDERHAAAGKGDR